MSYSYTNMHDELYLPEKRQA